MEKPEILAGFAETDFLNVLRIAQLRNYFGSLENAWNCQNMGDFLMAGILQKPIITFFERRKKGNHQRFFEKLHTINAQMIFLEDDNYPTSLQTIDAPPVFLFVRGELKREDTHSLSVVGARNITLDGKQMTERIIPELTRNGLAIISGLARGIDAVAHRCALENGGRTVAVLGSGIDILYPSQNRNLAENIITSGGAIISEFPPGVPPNAYNFPRRNRIVSGLSYGTLVIEGAIKSGSLITAHFALEQGREVFAVPGNPTSKMAGGPNQLIQRGEAKLILSAEDIINELPMETTYIPTAPRQLPSDPIQKTVFKHLKDEPTLFDDMLRESNYSSSQFSATLTILEIKGFAAHLGGNRWVRKI